MDRRSVTFDRGPELVAWAMLEDHVDLGSYYCDAHSPGQKGNA